MWEARSVEDAGHLDELRTHDALDRLEHARAIGPFVSTVRRFFEIEGLDQGGLLAVELFTTVIPIIVIGFSWLRGFASRANVGELFIRQLGIDPPLDQTVRAAFGTTAQLHSVWTLAGLAGFLVWGIPMSITVSRMFALAWRRQPFKFVHRLWRGAIWFLLYLVTMFTGQALSFDVEGRVSSVSVLVLSILPSFVFWAASPVILVRDGAKAWRQLLLAGIAGVVIDLIVLRVAARLIFPALLSGWQGFGSIGVAMTLMTWCGVIGVGWVVAACAGAVLWERTAPSATVIGAQTALPTLDAVARGERRTPTTTRRSGEER